MAHEGNQANEHHGRGRDFHAACLDAYEVAKQAGGKPPYVITEIEIHGSNPFDNFLVKISPKG
jgi:hypothetical protein